jgi:hypothetical protein
MVLEQIYQMLQRARIQHLNPGHRESMSTGRATTSFLMLRVACGT